MLKTKKQLLAVLLAVVTFIGILPMNAFAAEVTMDLSKAEVSWDYTLTDEEGNTFSAAYGIHASDNPFGHSIPANRRSMHDYTAKRPGLGGDKSEWVYGEDYVYCFCIEHGVPLPNAKDYAGSNDPSFGDKYERLSAAQKDLLSLALTYGYPNRTDLSTSKDANACYAATQLIVWQITLGFRTSATELNDRSYPASGYTGTMTEQYCSNKYFKHYYDRILSDMANHFKRPSFTSTLQSGAPTYEMKFENGRYRAALTDTNNVLQNFYVSSSGGVSATISGNTLTITSSVPITSAALIKLNRRIPSTYHTSGFLIWSVPGKEGENQDMVSGVPANNDPVPAYLRVEAPAGHVKLVKTSEDGKVEGVRFRITGNGLDKTVQTGRNGEVLLQDLQPGIYSVAEETDNRYEPQNTQRVTVVSGQTATVTFNNKLKRGELKVIKTSEDHFVEGVTFHLTGTSLSGLAVNEYARTNAAGAALFENVLIGSGYTLEEVGTAERYVIPEPINATVEWNKVTEKSVHNALKKFRVSVLKSDAETGSPQGDASLSGAVYGLYKGEQLVASYQTDQTGVFTSDWFVCDTDWTLREISASAGYLVDPVQHPIGADPEEYVIEYNELSMSAAETVKKGRVSIIKHCDDGSTQIETPESGAAFQIYLTKSGSYEAARESERDILTCDENGYCQSKALPYGYYTVHQIKGWDGKEFIGDFQVFISEDEEIYRFIINNDTFESEISIAKTDAETKKIIPIEGVGFRVKDLSTGEYISQHINYPTPVDISVFYTSSEGKLMLPQPLPYGNYELWEENSCEGYVLTKTPIPFAVDGSQATIYLEMPNMPQKGRITIAKTGQVFSSVSAIGGGYIDQDGNDIAFPTVYKPVYSVQGIPGAVYEVRAAEDIYTPDGTLRYAKGNLVSEITTDGSGKAVTEPLYLGKFEIREIKAPYGMLLNEEIRFAELVYAGQDIAITETSTGFYNERQKVSVSLEKHMEQNERFGIGQNGEILSVQFGLFAAEDLTAANGSVIPKDGLLETVRCDVNGKAVFSVDLPAGANCYVKEIVTDMQYILSDEKFPVVFEYAGQETAVVDIQVNNGEPITNLIIAGDVKGLKIDRETEETISGAVFGLFAPNETIFTAETALLTAESGSDGVFLFEDVFYGNWLIKELQPAEHFLPNEEIYPVQITEHEKVIEITVLNDRIPEIGTNAAVDGEKEIGATEVFTLEDTVSYRHLIPGKEYTVSGVLMDKTTGEPLCINGEEIHAETAFVPDAPSGEVIVSFTFDSRYLKTDTDIVVFETLYRDGKELAVHADIEDEDQTVTVKIPKIGTTATIEDKKKVNATEIFTLKDVVAYHNLTPGKEYVIKGVLMDKNTGKALVIDGEEIRSEVTFIPETANGEVVVPFVFDSRFIKEETDLVAYETLYRENIEIAAHTDIEDKDQTVSVFIPKIGTQASIEGNKESTVTDWVTIEDIVSYKNLTPGKEYIVKGVLMDKSTGKALLIDGKEIRSETTFIPENADGEIVLAFTFEGKYLKKTTQIVVFESLYREDIPIAVHADLEDPEQTVTVQVPPPSPSDSPQTGDTSHIWLWLALSAASGAAIILLSVRRRRYSK